LSAISGRITAVFKSESISAETKISSISSSTDLNVYSGKYKMTGLPFEFIVISIKEGKVMMEANGQVGELKPTSLPHTFDADGNVTLTFQMDDKKVVTKLKLDAMGFSFEGNKVSGFN